eukprot:PhM_4_TR15961/c0_g1_i1/m.45734
MRHSRSPARSGRHTHGASDALVPVSNSADKLLSLNEEPEEYPSGFTRATRSNQSNFRPSGFTTFSQGYVSQRAPQSRLDFNDDSFFFCGTSVVGWLPSPGTEPRVMARVDDRVWLADKGGRISVYDPETGKVVFELPAKSILCNCMTPVSSTETVWCGFADGFIRALQNKSLDVVMTLGRHSGPVNALAIHHDGSSRYMFSGSADFQIMQWDVETYAWIGQFRGHRNAVRSLALDGDILYSGSDDATIRVWDVYGKDVVEWKGHTKAVRHICLTPGLVWTAGEDATLRIWDKSTGECLQVHAAPHTGPISAMHVVGSRVWTSSMGTLYIWDTSSFSLVAEMSEHKAYVNSVVTIASSLVARLWTMGADGQIAAWDTEVCTDVDETRVRKEVERRTREVVYLKDALMDVEKQSQEMQHTMEEHAEELRGQIKSLESEIVLKEQEKAGWQAKIDDLHAELQSKDGEIAALREEVSEQEHLRLVSCRELNTRIADLQHELQEAKLSNKEPVSHVASFERIERQHQADVDRLRSLAAQHETKAKELQRRLNDVTQACDDADSEKARLQARIAELESSFKFASQHGDNTSPLLPLASFSSVGMSRRNSNNKNAASFNQGQKSEFDSFVLNAALPRTPVVVDIVSKYLIPTCAQGYDRMPVVLRKALQREWLLRDDTCGVVYNTPVRDAPGPANQVDKDVIEELRVVTARSDSWHALTATQQHVLLLTCMAAYKPRWGDLSTAQQEEWFLKSAIFPSAPLVIDDLDLTLAVHGSTLERRYIPALRRGEVLAAHHGLYEQPQKIVDESCSTDKDGFLSSTLGLGVSSMTARQKRDLLREACATFVLDWANMTIRAQEKWLSDRLGRISFEDSRTLLNARLKDGISHLSPQTLSRLQDVFQANGLGKEFVPKPDSKGDYWSALPPEAVRILLEDMMVTLNSDNGSNSGMKRVDLADAIQQLAERVERGRLTTAESNIFSNPEVRNWNHIPLETQQQLLFSFPSYVAKGWSAMSAAERQAWIDGNCAMPSWLDVRRLVIATWPTSAADAPRSFFECIEDIDPTLRLDSVLRDGLARLPIKLQQQIQLQAIAPLCLQWSDMDGPTREAWARNNIGIPTFAQLIDVARQNCKLGLEPILKAAVLGRRSYLPHDYVRVPMRVLVDGLRSVGSLDEVPLGQFDDLSEQEQEDLLRALHVLFDSQWETLSAQQQLTSLNSRGLLFGGKASTVFAVASDAIAAGTSLGTYALMFSNDDLARLAYLRMRMGAPTVNTARMHTLADVARNLGVSFEALLASNPHLAPNSSNNLTSDALVLRPSYDAGISSPQHSSPTGTHSPTHGVYVTSSGESLSDVARAHGMPSDLLQNYNTTMPAQGPLNPHSRVFIPAEYAHLTPMLQKAAAAKTASIHSPIGEHVFTARAGDTLSTISANYDIPLADLQSLNPHINAQQPLYEDTQIVIPSEFSHISRAQQAPTINLSKAYSRDTPQPYMAQPMQQQQQQPFRPPVHNAGAGQTLADVARQYNVPLEELRQANPSLPSSGAIPAGQTIVLPPQAQPAPQPYMAQPMQQQQQQPFRPPVHNAGAGQTLADVARQYNVPLEELRQANPSLPSSGAIPAGQTIVLPPQAQPAPQPYMAQP